MTTDPKQIEELKKSWGNRQITLRADLTISRLVSGDEAYYLAHDPVNFKNHRLSITDYRVVSHLRDTQTVDECFADLVDHGILNKDQLVEFYMFLNRLQRMGLLSLGFHDAGNLFESGAQQERQKSRARLLGFLSITIPLADPDRFLDRTRHLASILFTRWFGFLWAVAMVVSGVILWGRLSDFYEPFAGLLATKNLVFMAIAFVALKVWHELGHGYACKLLGGRVPEMGTIIIAGMPLAYVDASAAWRFEQRRHRILVMCGGMYFESIVALVAFWIWIANPHGSYAAFAYQLIVMAGISTVLFNANPLMKYDGYFIMCELLGVRNFRPRAEAELARVLKFVFLGIRTPASETSWPMYLFMLSFAVLAGFYKWTITFSIAALLCTRFMGLGIALGMYSVSMAIWGSVMKTFKYLLKSEECKSVRTRARVVLAGGIAMIILGLMIPVPGGLATRGIVGFKSEWRMRALTSGFLVSVPVTQGQSVEAGDELVQLENLEVESAFTSSDAEVRWQRKVLQFANSVSRLDAKQALDTLKDVLSQQAYAQEQFAQLSVRAPVAGKITMCRHNTERGKFIQQSEPIVTVSSGPPVVRCWMTADEIAAAVVHVGQTVPVRLWANGVTACDGVVISVATDGVHQMAEEDLSLTVLAGEALYVDPATRNTKEPLFRVEIELPELATAPKPGTRAQTLFVRKYQPLAMYTVDLVSKFFLQLYTE